MSTATRSARTSGGRLAREARRSWPRGHASAEDASLEHLVSEIGQMLSRAAASGVAPAGTSLVGQPGGRALVGRWADRFFVARASPAAAGQVWVYLYGPDGEQSWRIAAHGRWREATSTSRPHTTPSSRGERGHRQTMPSARWPRR